MARVCARSRPAVARPPECPHSAVPSPGCGFLLNRPAELPMPSISRFYGIVRSGSIQSSAQSSGPTATTSIQTYCTGISRLPSSRRQHTRHTWPGTNITRTLPCARASRSGTSVIQRAREAPAARRLRPLLVQPPSTAFQRFYTDNAWLICVALQKSHRIPAFAARLKVMNEGQLTRALACLLYTSRARAGADVAFAAEQRVFEVDPHRERQGDAFSFFEVLRVDRDFTRRPRQFSRRVDARRAVFENRCV